MPFLVACLSSKDFKTYSTPVRVASLNQFGANLTMAMAMTLSPSSDSRDGGGAGGGLTPSACIPKSMARSDDGKRYTIMTICSDVGLRPVVATAPAALGLDSFSRQQRAAAFWDHDDNNLGYSNGEFVDLQITFQVSCKALPFCCAPLGLYLRQCLSLRSARTRPPAASTAPA
eukprot:SAG22_NODE_342_length_11973_cov_10.127927_8_plen_173_part_00